MFYGMIRQRQGGTSGDASWYTGGPTNTPTDAKSVFWQAGSNIGNTGSDVTATFPSAYNQVPLVVASSTTASGFNTFVVITAITTTNFVYRVLDAGGTRRAETMAWIAIGQ